MGRGVPRVEKFDGIVVAVYSGEHGVPHFHASYGAHAIVIATDPGLEVLAGSLPPAQMRKLVSWAPDRIEEMQQLWNRLNGEDDGDSV